MRKRSPAALSAACATVVASAAAMVGLPALVGPSIAAAATPAFPGAEGFGANAVGGRGGDVYHVTTLADDPNHLIPGSLFYGLYEKNVPGSGTVPGVGRTIVFDVGGTIHLGSTTLDIKNIKNVTIAGQTAPSPITIIGNTVQITSSGGKETGNIILQHIAVRKGLENSGDALSIKGSGNTHDIMVDHVSGSWSEDEVISVAGATNHATNVTVQYSTMSEALTSGHQYGALIRNNQNASVSYNHNLFSNNVSRNPRPGTYLGTQLDFEFQNNVIYNWKDRAGYTGGASESDTENVNMNYAGNYLIAGPSTIGGPTSPAAPPLLGARRNTAFTKDTGGDPLNLHVYQSGNKMDWGSSAADPSRHGQDIGWTAFSTSSATEFPLADQNASPFAYPAAAGVDSADVAYAKAIGAVGMFPWARGSTDQRLITEVLSYGGVSGQTAPNAPEYNALLAAGTTTRAAGWDTDNDGMPNAWETLRGFNPAAADNNVVTAEGYTRLEKYLHFLSAQANWDLNADGNWSAHMNWRGMRPGSKDASANFIAGISAPRTITVDAPVTVGQLSFSSTVGYTLAGANALTVDVISGKAQIDVTAGNHTIAAPLALEKDTNINVLGGTSLAITNLQPTAAAIIKQGAGVLNVNGVRAAALNVQAGVVKAIPSGATATASRVASLTIAADAKLDLGDNKLVIAGGSVGSFSGSTYSGVQGMVQRGYVFGSWSGDGIVTSMPDAANGLTTLAVTTADQAGYGGGIFGGVSVSGSDVLVMYTYAGDVNLDGLVDASDYGIIDNYYQFPSTDGYMNGDFNYDGVIDAGDYGLIDNSYQLQGPPIPTGSSAVGLSGVMAIPEPSACALVGFVAAGLLSRRGRRCRRTVS
jgi:hypothetical protein